MVILNGTAKSVSYVPGSKVEGFDGIVIRFLLNDVIVCACLSLDKAFNIQEEDEVTVVGKIQKGVFKVDAGYNNTKDIFFQKPSFTMLIIFILTLPAFLFILLMQLKCSSPMDIGIWLLIFVTLCCGTINEIRGYKSLMALKARIRTNVK